MWTGSPLRTRWPARGVCDTTVPVEAGAGVGEGVAGADAAGAGAVVVDAVEGVASDVGAG
jgi:hypothetical protein